MGHLTVKGSREDSNTPATGLENLPFVGGEGPFVKKKTKKKKRKGPKKRHRKFWTHPPRQQKSIKGPGIQQKYWTGFSRHRKKEDGPQGRRWSLYKRIRKEKKKEHKVPRGSKILQHGCQGPEPRKRWESDSATWQNGRNLVSTITTTTSEDLGIKPCPPDT